MKAACAVLSIACILFATRPAYAELDRRYSVLVVGYEGASARYGDASAFNHVAPHLELVHYGVDWFLKVEAGNLAPIAPSGGGATYAQYATEFVAGAEIGVHWATIPFGILAVGLKAGGAKIGIRDRAGLWITGGSGVDAGVVVHYAFPCFGFLRVDPSISGGGSYLDGGASFAGAWARGELELFVEVLPWAAIQIAGGLDLRSYSSRSADPMDGSGFEGRVLRIGLGLAFHPL